MIARQVFKYVTPIYIKRLIRRQMLCDYILAPKRNSYTKGYLLDEHVENFHCANANQGARPLNHIMALLSSK